MKKLLFLTTHIFLFSFFSFHASAQAPSGFTYQSVLRDANSDLILNTSVGTQISILQGSSSGTAVYVETHSASTNANGLLTLEVGSGSVQSGTFSSIDWSDGPYFIKAETDPAGGTSYTITGVQQMMSVPYALFAAEAGSTSSDVDEITDADGDTKIQVEESADDDTIRFDIKGTQVASLYKGSSDFDVLPGFFQPDGLLTLDQYGLLLRRTSSGAQVLTIEGQIPGTAYPYARIDFRNTDNTFSTNTIYTGASIRSHNANGSGVGDLRFFVGESETLQEAMRIDDDGNIGIGITDPNATLSVAGSFQYADGNEAAGHVLTSDADGNASWEAMSGTDELADADGDTKIQVEESGDEDIIRFDLGGNERIVLKENANGDLQIQLFTNNYNTFIGQGIGGNNIGDDNTFIGAFSGVNNTSGTQNTFIGRAVGHYTQGGSYNTFIGRNSGFNNTSGSYNVFLGLEAGVGNITGDNNVYLGARAGRYTTTGEFNVYVGRSAGSNNVSGSGNVCIGWQAGQDETGSNKLYIENSDADSSEALIYGEFDNDILAFNANVGIGTAAPGDILEVYGEVAGTGITIANPRPVLKLEDTDANTWLIEMNAKSLDFTEETVGTAMTIEEITGHVGIGTTNPFGALHVLDDAGTGSAIISVEEESGHQYDLLSSSATHTVNPNGFAIYDRTASQYRVLVNENGNVGIGTSDPSYKLQVGASGDGTQARANAWNINSDRRWKKNFEVIPDALGKLAQVHGYFYDWKEGADSTRQVGIIAQDIEAILPQAVSTDENGYKSVDYGKLTAWLIQVNKEQEEKIGHLQAELKTERASNEARLQRLEELLEVDAKAQR